MFTPLVITLSEPTSSWISLRLIVPSARRARSFRAAEDACLALYPRFARPSTHASRRDLLIPIAIGQ